MDIQSNKNFYILLLLFAALVAGILAILYIHSQKKQKAFENAINELKEEALKYMKNQVDLPFSEYTEVTQEETQKQEQEKKDEQVSNGSEASEINHPVEFTLPQFVVTTTAESVTEDEKSSDAPKKVIQETAKRVSQTPIKEKAHTKPKTAQSKKNPEKKQEAKPAVEEIQNPLEQSKTEEIKNNNN